jgi:hypothetical protein
MAFAYYKKKLILVISDKLKRVFLGEYYIVL